jgi:SAM-dependent methyltransferase
MGDPLRALRLLRATARHPRRVEALYRGILAEIGEEPLAAARRRIVDALGERTCGDADTAGLAPEQRLPYTKYLDVGYYLRHNVVRALDLGLDRAPVQRVLDLGCGAGFFLAACRHLGHEVRGLDLGGIAVFDELICLLSIPRVEHEIRPRVPLPRLDGEPFHLITAFAVRFDRLRDGRRWSPSDWESFLADVRSRLAPGGRFVCKWNRASRGLMREESLRGLFARCTGFETRFLDEKRVSFRRVG